MRQPAAILTVLITLSLAMIGCSSDPTNPDYRGPQGLTVISSSTSPFTALVVDSAYVDARNLIAWDETTSSEDKAAAFKALYDDYLTTGDWERVLASQETWQVELDPGEYWVECFSHGDEHWANKYFVKVLNGKNHKVTVSLD
jgi:hypothetical protein